MTSFKIGNRNVGGQNDPTFIIAEMSCNHNNSYEIAIELIHKAHEAGADAIKLQTYTADTMTINCDKEYFKIINSPWEQKTLYDLYNKVYMPWEWHEGLKKEANMLGMELFSSPFDPSAVDFLENLDMPAYKIASFEITDHILIKKIAQTGKPVIISSGMASISDMSEAIQILRNNGCQNIGMLKCTSAYPSDPKDANLSTIQNMKNTFNVVPGLSDHTLGIEVPVVSVAMGAKIIEKHFTLSRESGSPDDAFSLTPEEFKQMVKSVRIAEKTIGKITYGGVKSEDESKNYRRSLFVIKEVKKGDVFNNSNIRSIRPGHGLHTKFYSNVIGRKAKKDISFGTPLSWDLVD